MVANILTALALNWLVAEIVVLVIDNPRHDLRRWLFRCPLFIVYFVVMQFWPILFFARGTRWRSRK